MSRGDLFIVSSPSGAGKTTLIRRVLEDPRIGGSLHFSVSHTTRLPRVGERTGVEYHFVDEAAFRAIETRGGFLEWAVVHGNLYGTSRDEVEPRLDRGIDVLLDIDVQGARQVRSHVPEAVKVIVFPPSREVLEMRLKARGSDAPDVVLRRLAVARKEMEEWGEFDYAIINEDLEAAVDELRSILVARRAGKSRRRERLESILRSFAP
ncbi:MAG: guanylate kinase [Acidobacteriota bacterium]|nr:guanylate kinase [Acidobacteriota bacterium]